MTVQEAQDLLTKFVKDVTGKDMLVGMPYEAAVINLAEAVQKCSEDFSELQKVVDRIVAAVRC